MVLTCEYYDLHKQVINQMANLIGKKVNIKKNIDSPYAGEWGIIRLFDGQDYHVALWDEHHGAIVLSRNEFTLAR